MSESATETEAGTETTGAATGTEAAQGEATQAEAKEVDWREKFEAQQKITRDLEKKVKGEAGTLKQQLDALQAKLDGKEAEHAKEQEKRETEQAALSKANDRILRSEIKAAAKGVLADPTDAYMYLDLESFEVGDDGQVDDAAITAALDKLIETKPYLAAQGKRFQGGADGGTRKESGPAQLSEADVKRLYAEKNYDEIEKARTEGRLNTVLGIK